MTRRSGIISPKRRQTPKGKFKCCRKVCMRSEGRKGKLYRVLVCDGLDSCTAERGAR